MAAVTSLADAVSEHVHDGDMVAVEGVTHLIPFAAGHEIIRQRRRDLTMVRMTPDVIYDQLIGAGCARKLIFSWGGNPGVGSLHRFRDAIQDGWPVLLEIEEHSHAGMANRYVARASALPFAMLSGYAGTDLIEVTDTIASIICPFTGETLAAVPALTPDVTIIHAQRADGAGNIALWGICSRRSPRGQAALVNRPRWRGGSQGQSPASAPSCSTSARSRPGRQHPRAPGTWRPGRGGHPQRSQPGLAIVLKA
jgi:glutaconate CoA-transferase subunit A